MTLRPCIRPRDGGWHWTLFEEPSGRVLGEGSVRTYAEADRAIRRRIDEPEETAPDDEPEDDAQMDLFGQAGKE